MPRKKIDWQNPLQLAEKIAANYRGESWVFLYSGLHKEVKNSISYLALFPLETICCEDFATAENIINQSDKRWFGYLSYEVAHEFEKFPKTKKSHVALPKIWLTHFALILEFNHDKQQLTANFTDESLLYQILTYDLRLTTCDLFPCIFDSNFTDHSYLTVIAEIQNQITRGDLYQTNLTRKFFGEFAKKPNAFLLFLTLTKSSPTNYSAFLKFGENFVISASPELFLEVKNGCIKSRPIKGTAPRGSSAKEDLKNKSHLKNSPKERAENLMIVDLVRNDLSRICKAGSVIVKNLFHITTYKNIHHMSSEISGKIAKEISVTNTLQACFPPGSMTGAPKIKAMEVAAKEEKIDRGIYSGALGFIDKKSLNLSVVIRTLIVSGKKFEFQAGGAITYESSPQMELEEVFSKAKGIIRLLSKPPF
ncbi:MAG: hypothetical protein FJX34_03590 [Alphaproteobacteria bacterium]|nr:hypothetical protein [Alphaproteobacteria bacterium]